MVEEQEEKEMSIFEKIAAGVKAFQSTLDTKYKEDQAKVNAGKPKATEEELKPKISAKELGKEILRAPSKALVSTSVALGLPALTLA